jgi:alanine dehydrogenase
MQTRILSAADVRRCIDMPTAIEAMRDAFSALALGRARVPMRLAMETGGGVSLFMPGYLPDSDASAVKIVSVHPDNAARGLPAIHAVVLAIEPETGRVRAFMDGSWLTALRTGAVGGLAADLLARPDASVVALFGAGVQARTQLEAVRCVRPVTEVRVVSRTGASAAALVAELEGVEARTASAQEAIDGADIVIAATSSVTPVFDGAAVQPGTHITGVGSYTTEMREIDGALVARARVIVDEGEVARAEAGDLVGAIRDGLVDDSVFSIELGDVVLGRVPGRSSPDEITFFKSVGNAVQDVAVAHRVLAAAEAGGIGTVVEL